MTAQFQIDGKKGSFPPGTTLFAAAETLGVQVPTSCRCQGKCRECMVEISSGMAILSPKTEEEAHLQGVFRLSCRCTFTDADGSVGARTLRRNNMRIEDHGISRRSSVPLNPAITRHDGKVWRGEEEFASFEGPIHGLALDIGTTTVVVRLFNLESGCQVATSSFENPQRFGGSDVMARIQYDTDYKGKLLQRTLLGYLTHSLESFPVPPSSICEIVVAGNPTMRDLFFGLDVSGIGQRPYQSITEKSFRAGNTTTTAIELPAKKLRLPTHPQAIIYGMPLISGHVGSDAAACLLAVDAPDNELFALMDIGTNTELIMGRQGRLLAASCPAGPAFEGGRIRHGMPGVEGAIEKTVIDSNGHIRWEIIGQGPPLGLCGAGLVSLLSELIRTGRINELGRFNDGSKEFEVVAESGICLHEKDINELAQAKGANTAGLQILLTEYGISGADLDRFYLAGGFGKHIGLSAARRIGMLPDLPEEKLLRIGNAAVEGASIALLNVDERRRLEKLTQGIVHVELEKHPHFFDFFVDGCQFTPEGKRTTE